MKLTVVSREQVAARIASRWGSAQDDETLLDLIRAEVTARGCCPRWTALRRLEEALEGHSDQSRDRLRELCRALEYEGDVTSSKGGVLHSSPVRAIRLEVGTHRLVCSLPTERLRACMPGGIEVDGPRRLHRFDSAVESEANDAVRALGGAVMSPEDWAGLDRAPIADRAWLDALDQRLEWRAESGGSLERDGALDWQSFVVTEEGPRWRRAPDDPSRLWRARTAHGRWVWAWATAERTPSTGEFVTLTDDDGSRTLFALARSIDRPVSASLVREDNCTRLRIREWLPRAEYRYLASIAPASRVENHQQWSIPIACLDDVQNTLSRRLGLGFEIEKVDR